MSARSGAQYLEGLRDERVVWDGGKQVCVLTHPAFAGSLAGMAGYVDWQLAHADDCLTPGSFAIFNPPDDAMRGKRTEKGGNAVYYSEWTVGAAGCRRSAGSRRSGTWCA